MARTWYRNQALSRLTTTSTTYSDVVSLTFTPAASTDYYLLWSAIFDSSVTTDNNRHRLRDDTAGANLANPNHRSQNTTEKMSVGGIAKWTSGGSPGSQTFSIEHLSEVSGTVTGTSDAQLIAIRKETGDEYAESTSTSSTTSSTLSDKTTLTFTPASAGDYLILVSAEISGFISSSPFHARGRCLLDVGGTQYLDTVDGYMALTASQFASWAGAAVVHLGASAQTLKIRYASSDNATTAQIRQARLLAIRLDGFTAASTDQDNTRQTTTADTPQAAATVTVTAPAADHLIVGSAVFDYSTSFAPVWGNLKVDAAGTDRNLYLKRQFGSGAATNSTGARTSFIAFGFGALSAGTHTLNTDWWSSSTGHMAGVRDAFIGAFLLDNVDAETPVPLAASGLSGLAPAVATGGAAIVPVVAGALAALVPAVSASVFLALPSATVALNGAVPGIALDAAVAVASQAATITCRAPLALADKVVRAGAGAMALSAPGPVRAGPTWRAINENQAVWDDREPTISAWTPVPAA